MSNENNELVSCFCDEASDLLVKWESTCLSLEKSPNDENWNTLFRIAHNLKGTSRAVGLDAIGSYVHKVEDLISSAKQNLIAPCAELFRRLLEAQSELAKWVDLARVNSEVPFTAEFKDYVPNESNHVENQSSVEKIIEFNESPVVNEVVEAQSTKVKSIPTKATQQAAAVKNTNNTNLDEMVRVSAKKLDQLIQLVGELSIQQNVLKNINKKLLEKYSDLDQSIFTVDQLQKLTRNLYERTLSLRMQPIQPVFQRLERNIRDISKSMQKDVIIEVSGSEVELDKTVCEKIIEPLTHMVRNSIDHGIESPEDRLLAGKSKEGIIKLKAIQESSSVVIIIEDDGKGLDESKILAKAKSNGIITDSTQLSQAEIFALIFLPGFSTAEKVTDVSGRGVGMDVVMRSIDSLKGQINIASEKGKGTRFTIQLPTTLSLIDALIIKQDGLEYAVPVDSIEEVIEVDEHFDFEKESMFKLRDTVIPITILKRYFGNQNNKKSNIVNSKAMIVKQGKQRIALAVESIGEEQQIVVRKLEPAFESVFGFSGWTVLGTGEPGLIVDVNAITKKYLYKFTEQNETKENVA